MRSIWAGDTLRQGKGLQDIERLSVVVIRTLPADAIGADEEADRLLIAKLGGEPSHGYNGHVVRFTPICVKRPVI